ncbi:hypothetical protein PAXINDRAFT_14765 [Paxillus involutus ATCC 200175]|uniref:Uncharacterized protein n=1 Tax=Paxillus involutus ATCC 200175 TaxID=664439 RepID=A0A0C9TYR5_PAXIN|nr:hypothetical protein PAXINDRAFT_14765 [Paxillus involutus ATCC 200175]
MLKAINVQTSVRTHSFSLKELNLTVCFLCTVNVDDIPNNIPVELSVWVVDKWAGHIFPVIEITDYHITPNEELSPDLFPFLLLPPQFDNQSQREWSSPAQDIQHWLLYDPNFSTTDPHSYSLMQELFWMADTASSSLRHPVDVRDVGSQAHSQCDLQQTFY